ncbi:hypothetical protein ABFG93_04845 [Pseudalkalibacillus hwajinpoensis]|uniref:hypothetical protein n=1 Tax=Guptibacillus hwajinpoensis TaxID=208199 RepID=UPI00325B50F0
MVTKNAGKLSKKYFKSYIQLVMNSRGFSLEEAKAFTFKELFQGDEMTNGQASYQQFLEACEEMSEEALNKD